MKNLLILVNLLLLSACASTSPLCTAVTDVDTSFATTVAAQCGCVESEVQATLFSAINVTGMCKVTSGPIALTVCPLAGELVSGLVSSGLQSSKWACTNAQACLGTVLQPAVALCETLPFTPAPKPL